MRNLPINRLVISAPFGNWFNCPGATRTLGTYTLRHRAGTFKRLWRILSTVRYWRRPQAWINKLGLPNPGIAHLYQDHQDAAANLRLDNSIVSIHGFDSDEWSELGSWVAFRLPIPAAVELNLSCPNVGHTIGVEKAAFAVARVRARMLAAGRRAVPIIAKIGPVRWDAYAEAAVVAGADSLHLCNTIPTPGGGISGTPLKQFSLWAVEGCRKRWPDMHIIGGGGVSSQADIWDYHYAGADAVAVGSALFNPLNWKRVRKWALDESTHWS